MNAPAPTNRSVTFAYAAILAQTAISAGTFLFAKRALAELGPLALALVRFAASSVVFAAIAAVAVRPLWPGRRWWKPLALLALLGVPLNQGLFMTGLARSTPSHAALLYTLTPMVVLVFAALSGAERPGRRKMLGLALALAGAATVVLERGGGAGAMQATVTGDLLIFGAVVAWGAFTAFGKPIVSASGPIAATSWSLVLGTVMFLPLGVPAAAAQDWSGVSATAWWSVAYLVVFTSVVAYLCWYYALKVLEPSRVAVFTNLQPVGTAALSWAFLGERITGTLVAGAVLVIAGVLVTTRPEAKRA